MRAVRGQTVRAETDATIQAIDVLLVLLCLLVNYASVVELLGEEDLKPSGSMRGGRNELHG